MDKQSLAQLVEISRAVGANPDYVQAAGGNTSVKSPDGRTMAIKASGTALTSMSESSGWVEMDVAAVLGSFGAGGPGGAALEPNAEARVAGAPANGGYRRPRAALGGNRAARHAGTRGGTHARRGGQCGELRARARGAAGYSRGRRAAAAVGAVFRSRGGAWRREVKTAAEAYRQGVRRRARGDLHGEPRDSGGRQGRAASAWRCTKIGCARCARVLRAAGAAARAAPALESAALRKTMAGLRRAWREACEGPCFARFSDDPELAARGAQRRTRRCWPRDR